MLDLNKKHFGFTLAEMMVVMLIITIILAFAAPLMTKRRTQANDDKPWNWASNINDAYFAVAESQSAMLGQSEKEDSDSDNNGHPRLIIRTTGASPAILLKSAQGLGNVKVAELVAFHEAGNNTLKFGGPFASGASGTNNTAFGSGALTSSTGDGNVAFGGNALNENTIGVNNTAVGYNSLHSNAGASSNNTAIGYNALGNLTTGNNNVGIGSSALSSASGNNNIGIGSSTLSSATGNNNIGIGSSALGSVTTGSNNVAIGASACANVTTGSGKVCIGAGSGPASGSGLATNSTKVIWLGDAGTTVYIPGHLVVDLNTVLGYYSGTTPNPTTTWINMVEGSDSASGHRLFAVGWQNSPGLMEWRSHSITSDHIPMLSDRRLKNISGESTAGLDKIRALKVFNYTFKKDEKKTPHVGVVAQDLQEIFPDAVTMDFDGYLRIRQEDMFYAVVNAVKELDKFVQEMLANIKDICEKITGIDNRVKVLEQENAQLKEQLDAINKRLEKLESK